MSWRGTTRRWFRVGRHILGVLVLTGLAAFLYFSSHGVPRRYVDRWLAGLRAQGYHITVERIRLDLIEGIVADDFRLFEDQDQRAPMLEAERVALFLNPLAWLRHEIGLRRLRVHNGCLRLGLAEQPASNAADVLVFRNVSGVVSFQNDAWRLNDMAADLLGLKISCRGVIRLARQVDRPEAQSGRDQSSGIRVAASQKTGLPNHNNPQTDSAQEPADAAPGSAVAHKLNALTHAQRERIAALVEQLNAIAFSVPPHADITFQIDTEHPADNEAALRMEGAATRVCGILLDQWHLQAEFRNGRMRVGEAGLQQRGERLAFSGAYTFSNRVAEARLHGRLIPQDWLTLAPPAWSAALAQSGLYPNGPIQCDIALDAAPVEQALDHLRGWLALTQLDARGVWIEQGFVGFALGAGTITLDPLYLLLGKGVGQGPLQGQLNYAWDTGDYEGRLDTQFDPRLLAPWLNSNQLEYVGAFACREQAPLVELDFSGQAGRDDSFWAAGGMQASNFSYYGVPVDSFQCRLGYANGLFAMDDIRLIRPEGEVSGRFELDLDASLAEGALLSTANPKAIARIIGPEVAAYLDGFHFGGPMRIAARGQVDYGAGTRTAIRAEIDGKDWGHAPLHFTRAALDLAVKEFRFDLTNIVGEAYEGTFSGQASFYPSGATTNFRYDISAKADDINLNTLLQALGYDGKEEYEGLIYTQGELNGNLGAGQARTAAGRGWLRIQDGQLYQLRLLGGFSRLLSIIDPGLGEVSLTDFAASFLVKENKIDTRNAALSGPTLAVHGEGYYAFDDHLDFIVWVQPPDHNRLLPNLSKVAVPLVTKLLAVRLTGTLSDPKWWPLNLTRDQLLALPKDILVTLPKDVLLGLPHDLLVSLPKEVLVTLPQDILFKLPRQILIDLPEELFIKLPQDVWKMLRPAPVKAEASSTPPSAP